MIVLTTAKAGTPEWFAARKGRLGAYAIASICGVGFDSPLETWSYLTEKIPQPDISKRPSVRRGLAMEDAIKRLYCEDTGRTLRGTPGVIQHPSVDWIASSPDDVIYPSIEGGEGRVVPVGWTESLHPTPSRDYGVLEAKSPGFQASKQWELGIPEFVIVQLHVQMACTELMWGSAVAMPADPRPTAAAVLWHDLVFDAVLWDRIMNRLVDFRDKHWLRDIPPPPEAGDLEQIKLAYPRETPGVRIPMPESLDVRWRTRKDLQAEIKERQAVVDAIEAEMKLAMGLAEYMDGPGYSLQYKVEPRNIKAKEAHTTTPRVLREKSSPL